MPGPLAAFINALEPQGMRMIFAQADFGGLTVSSFMAHLTMVVVLIAGCVKIWKMTRREPSVDDTFATKKELAAMQDALSRAGAERQHHIDEKILGVDRAVKELRKDLKTDLEGRGKEREQLNLTLNSIYLALGRLEGKSAD